MNNSKNLIWLFNKKIKEMEEKIKFVESVNKDSKNEISKLNDTVGSLRNDLINDSNLSFNQISNNSFNNDPNSTGKLNYKKGLVYSNKKSIYPYKSDL